jgi:predicted LPLAT superfamily acyltransferase
MRACRAAAMVTGAGTSAVKPDALRWSGRSWGGTWLFKICVSLLPLVGSGGAWLISFVIASAFSVIGGRSQFGMVDYWRRMRPHSGASMLRLLAFRHFASFGRILCDRLLVYRRPQDYHVTVEGGDLLRDFRVRRQGCILLSAHLGNWELASYWLNELTGNLGNVHVVMVRDDPQSVQRFVDTRMRGGHTRVIDPHDGLGASLAITSALNAGDMVCMLGDRVLGEQPSITARFLNGQAQFPLGPFQTAAITGVPILVGFLMKTGRRSYVIQIEEPWRIRLPELRSDRRAVLQAAVQRWANRLEIQVRRFPQQWHNFYNFWQR